ncbi:MAG: hypothetical protein GEV09_24475 [Pseudonocardiaceae bacterium]|nr:hypothetical protein [Pseudonocardiaceae bacterium]
MMITLVVVGLLLIGLGALIGSSWTLQALEGRFRQHAAERRRLNEEWQVVRAVRAEQRRCVQCEDERDPYRQPALVAANYDRYDD